ncbi:hypothetical protein J5N97_004958 [Dioscorea zingiberensis]|uniref:Phospholipid scramblase n=1 Tax=Dioscorea zingiberensis TaxID=325984 RepID=A0A9D5D8Y7_9LILI|nr:hypothetical protein J5N97_004958 [Dioscorea zingiberensis]
MPSRVAAMATNRLLTRRTAPVSAILSSTLARVLHPSSPSLDLAPAPASNGLRSLYSPTSPGIRGAFPPSGPGSLASRSTPSSELAGSVYTMIGSCRSIPAAPATSGSLGLAQVKLAPLLARPNLLVTRDIEWANVMFDFEQESRYIVVDPNYPHPPMGYIREQSNVIYRQLFRKRRPFVASINDAKGNEIFRDKEENVLAQIDRDWRGFGLEISELKITRPLTLTERAVVVALAVSLDTDYFSTGGGW